MDDWQTWSSEYLAECEDIDSELSVSPGLFSEDFLFHNHFLFSMSVRGNIKLQYHITVFICKQSKIILKRKNNTRINHKAILKLKSKKRQK